MLRFTFLVLILFPDLSAQDEAAPLDPAAFDRMVAGANAVFRLAWPLMVAKLQQELTQSLEEMGDMEMVRKMKVTNLELSEPPGFRVIACPGKPQCRRLRLTVPGDGRWSLKMSGEIIPPWQKNQEKFRKLRLTLKDLSLKQDYEVDLSDPEKLTFRPLGPPELTYRLTSPNLLYKAVLAAAQGFLKDALEEVLKEEFQDMEATEIALGDMKALRLDNLIAQMSSSLSGASAMEDEADEMVPGDALVLFPLEEPGAPQIPGEQADDAFSVAFTSREVDPYAASFPAKVAIRVPPGARIEEVTFKLGTREVARLTQPPWRIQVTPEEEDQVLLATATLSDGIQEDDYLYLPGRGHIEEFEVNLVDLYLNFPEKSISEAELKDLHKGDFIVRENGTVQEVATIEVAIDRPLDLMMVVDMSGSMEGARIKDARRAAGKFVEKIIRPGDRMHLITYSDRVKAGPALTDRRQMMQAIKQLDNPRGATRTFDAVGKAMDLFGDEAATRVVLLLTDGYNYGSRTRYEDLKRRLEQDNVLLYIVGIDITGNDSRLRGDAEGMMHMIRPKVVHLQQLYDMSAITGGRPFFIDKPAWLGKAFDAVERDLRSQVRLGYYSNLPSSAKGWREIQVRQKHSDRALHHKKGYWKE